MAFINNQSKKQTLNIHSLPHFLYSVLAFFFLIFTASTLRDFNRNQRSTQHSEVKLDINIPNKE